MRSDVNHIIEAIDATGQGADATTDRRMAIKLQLLDLAALKERVGPRWKRSERMIHMLVEACIRRAITHADRWGMTGDGQYLLFLHNSSEGSAKELCDAILEDLTTKLFGTGDIEDRPHFAIDLLNLGPDALFGGASARLQAIVAARSVYSLHSHGEKNSGTLARAKAASTTKTERDEPTVVGAEDIASLVRLADKETRSWQIEEKVTKASSLPGAEGGAGAAHGGVREKGYFFSYTPIWDRTKRALLCYRVNFSIQMPHSPAMDTASPELFGQLDRSTTKAIDLLRMKRALGSLMKSHRQGNKYLISVPVSAQSCSQRWGVPTVFEQLAGVPKAIDKLVIFDIIDADRPEYRAAIGEIAATAARFGRQSLLRVGPNYEGGLFSGVTARPIGIGIDVGSHNTDERELMRFLDRLAEEASGKSADTFIWGAESTSAAMMAIAAGVTFVGGTAVANDVPDPVGVSMLGLSDIFA